MLSQIDIVKALGDDIVIYPFNEGNLKENSYNLTASKYAFASKDSDVPRYKIKKGRSCVVSKSGISKIILLPHSTTLIITEEVLGVRSLGGTYHSKVGLASIGLGHIGTMLGPNFCGHSLIAVHNISGEIKEINVGDSFASLVFHKLDTPITDRNATVNAHLDKFATLGISEDISEIHKDWKIRINDVSDRMKQSTSYKDFTKKKWRYRFNEFKSYFNVGNVLIASVMLALLFSPKILTFLADMKLIEDTMVKNYHSFFYNIALSGLGIFLFQGLYSLFKKK